MFSGWAFRSACPELDPPLTHSTFRMRLAALVLGNPQRTDVMTFGSLCRDVA
jgi:hypothetical protein